MRVSVEKRFNSLVREHNSEVRNYLGRRLYPLGTIDLDDLVEETWIVVWRRVDRVPVSEPLPWLIGVARNVLRNAKRAHNRRDHYEGQVIASHSQPSAEEVTVKYQMVSDSTGTVWLVPFYQLADSGTNSSWLSPAVSSDYIKVPIGPYWYGPALYGGVARPNAVR